MIRLAGPDDAAAVAAIYRPAVATTAASFELEPPDPAEMARRVARTLQRTPWLVYDAGSDGVLGYAYAGPHRERPAYQWSVEVSAYVRADARRGGVGRALYDALLAVLLLQGFRNAYAAITLPNDASVRLHEAAGFTTVGVFRRIGWKHGAWHDVLWLARDVAPHDADPAPPRALPQLLDSPDFTAALATGAPR